MDVSDPKSGKINNIEDLMRLCPEAQADGVPCPELGRQCEICERAMRIGRPEGPSDDPDSPVSC